jgi:D-inositol-3-phosphate glycosyltransferase
MAAETAIVATDVGEIRRVLDGEAAGRLVPAHDPVALATAIGGLLARPEARLGLAQAARSRVLTCFSLERNVREIFHLYTALLGDSQEGWDSAHSM